MFDYRSVVVILPERLGDSLFHTPTIRLLKTQRPDIKLGVIALSTLCAKMLESNPYVDAMHVLPSKHETKRIAANYDATLILHNHAHARKYAQWLDREIVTIKHDPVPKHWSQHSLDFMYSLLQCEPTDTDSHYTLFPGHAHHFHIAILLHQHKATANEILIGCHIGCHSLAKRSLSFWRPPSHPKAWPLERFIELAAELRKVDKRFRLVLTGSKSERSLGQKLMKFVPSAINLIDRTSVLDLAALMQKLDLFITGDTGALHVACASEVGMVALFGPTNSQVYGPHPRQARHTVIQATELADIDVPQVIKNIVSHSAIVSRLSTSILK